MTLLVATSLAVAKQAARSTRPQPQCHHPETAQFISALKGKVVTMDAPYEDDNAFLTNVVHGIPGWLVDYTPLTMMDILKFQEQIGMSGSIFEIGVFAGRYFAILLRSAIKNNSGIAGLELQVCMG